MSSASVAVLILTRIRSGSDDTGGGTAEDDGTADDGGAWLLGAALDGLAWDAGGAELGAWWEALPWEDTSGVSGSGALDSGRPELSRAEDSGKLDVSDRDAAGGSDGRLAVDVGMDAASLCSLSFWPPGTIAIMIISAANATKKPRDSKIVFLLIFFFLSMFTPREK